MIEFEKALNPEQLAAATAPDGPLLVLAAAGTGKTRTLTYRVAYLVQKGIPPERLLLLTFTNRAAREMLDRAHDLVGAGVGGIWGGTFHHMANRLLRRHAPTVGFPSDFVILDRDDARTLISQCVKDLKLNDKEFPKRDVLLSLFSAAANTERPLSGLIEQRFADFDTDPADVLAVHKAYEARKRELASMDFDDLLVNCLRLFRERKDLLERYQAHFLHVLVDEYQDTNTIQAELVDRIAGQNRNVLVVGDDFQSIYSWRGADYRNIMSFPDRYPDTKIFKLETNYRSVPEILDVANACIAGNPEQFQKTLRPTRDAHRKPVAAYMRDGEEQARFVLDYIAARRRDGYPISDIAVLYRAHFHAMELERALAGESIRYVITSGVRYFEQAHIKDVCSLLRLLDNPTDEMAFLRLTALLPGVGDKTAAKTWRQLGGKFDAHDPAQHARLKEALRPPARAVWEKIEPICRAYREENLNEDAGEVIYRFVEAFYKEHATDTFDNASDRLDDIQELILYTSKFDRASDFLSDVALATNLDAEVADADAEEAPTLRLSTIHQAKGLEWPVVILLWVTEGMFPSPRSVNENGDGEAEERRLFYVAVTRAKDELCLCLPEVRRTRDGGVFYCEPSRFVRELPPKLLKTSRVTLV